MTIAATVLGMELNRTSSLMLVMSENLLLVGHLYRSGQMITVKIGGMAQTILLKENKYLVFPVRIMVSFYDYDFWPNSKNNHVDQPCHANIHGQLWSHICLILGIEVESKISVQLADDQINRGRQFAKCWEDHWDLASVQEQMFQCW